MKLFYSPFHNFIHKVLVVAHEAGLEDRIETVPTFPFRDATGAWVEGQYDITMLNPLGKVPFLALDDGTTLYSSQVVVEYLDSLAPKTDRLFPEDGPQRIDAVRRLAMGDGIFEFAVQMVMEDWRDAELQRQDLFEWLWPKIANVLDTLENEASTWAGFDIGHAGLLQGISFTDSWAGENERIPGNAFLDWRSKWPQVADWFATTCERPSIIAHYNKPYSGDMSADNHRTAVADVLKARANAA